MLRRLTHPHRGEAGATALGRQRNPMEDADMAGLFAKLTELFATPAEGAAPTGHDPKALALAALMVQLADADGDFDASERARIETVLTARFGDGATLLAAAEARAAAALDSHQFTRALKQAYEPEERISLIEDLWEVVLADETRDPNEDALMRQLGALLHVSDRDIGLARQRVLAR